jgi:hypothetical protein
LTKAINRWNLVSINHHLEALLASYIDVIFTVYHTLHPGKKRLVSFAHARCEKLPVEMASGIAAVLQAPTTADPKWMTLLTWLLDHLDFLLEQECLDPHLMPPGMDT